MNKFFSIGEVLIDFLPTKNDSNSDTYSPVIGGAPANVAVSLSKLGVKSYFIGKVGDDIFGSNILESLSECGVNTKYLTKIKNKKTALAFVILDENGERQFEFYRDNCADESISIDDIPLNEFCENDILHFGSISMISDVSRKATEFAIESAKSKSLLISYDPNLRPMLWSSEDEMIATAKKYMCYANIIKLSTEEVIKLYGECNDTVISNLFNDTTKLIFVTDGANGSYAYTQNNKQYFPAYKVKCVDSTGAGDAFVAGILFKLMTNDFNTKNFDSLLENLEMISHIMSFASCNAAITTTRKGVFDALPSLIEIENFIKCEKNSIIDNTPDPNKAILQKYQKANSSIYKPNYHIVSPSGWINDPNGLIKFDGKYHVFYQLHPFSSEWGPMHWGHVISEDFVNWKHLDIALSPNKAIESGCFSGSAVSDNGVLTLIYTSHNMDRNPKEYQCVAKSFDSGVTFLKEEKPIIPMHPDECSSDFRDPKVWKHNDVWYMIIGSGKNNRGKIPLYTSKDFKDWKYKGILCSGNSKQGNVWECPNYFKIGNQDVLIVSPMNMKGHKNIFIYGELNYDTNKFTQTKYEEIDYGNDFYAAQIFYDESDRVVMIGWMDMWGNIMPTQADGFAGALTFPREITLKENKIHQYPIHEIESLYEKNIFNNESFKIKANTKNNLTSIKGNSLDIKLSIVPDKSVDSFLFLMACSDDYKEKTTFKFDIKNNKIVLDKSLSGEGSKDKKIIDFNFKKTIELRILVDCSSIEVFVDDGEIAITSRIYPKKDSINYDIYSENGDLSISNCFVNVLKNIWA